MWRPVVLHDKKPSFTCCDHCLRDIEGRCIDANIHGGHIDRCDECQPVQVTEPTCPHGDGPCDQDEGCACVQSGRIPVRDTTTCPHGCDGTGDEPDCPRHGATSASMPLATEPTCKRYGAGHRCTLPEGHGGNHYFDAPLHTDDDVCVPSSDATTNMPSLAPREHKLLFLAGADAERARIAAQATRFRKKHASNDAEWNLLTDLIAAIRGGDDANA
jgi:hypothetical protein